MKPNQAVAVAVAVMALLGACGDDDDRTAGSSSGEARTVEVDMVDIAFEPDTLELARGDTVRFLFTNRGKVAHDAFIGSAADQAHHEADMRAGDGGHGGHEDDDEAAVTVEPGDTEELTYTFDESGRIEIGCHQPGHYDAGMKVVVEVD